MGCCRCVTYALSFVWEHLLNQSFVTTRPPLRVHGNEDPTLATETRRDFTFGLFPQVSPSQRRRWFMCCDKYCTVPKHDTLLECCVVLGLQINLSAQTSRLILRPIRDLDEVHFDLLSNHSRQSKAEQKPTQPLKQNYVLQQLRFVLISQLCCFICSNRSIWETAELFLTPA